MDPDRLARLTFACATAAEQRAGRAAGLRTALVGLGARNGLPPGPLVSFGLAGALRDDLPAGTVLDATTVVDEEGRVLWEGEALGIPGALDATMLASERVIDEAADRRRLRELTGADAVDLESGPIGRSGRLCGVLRAVSDTPERTLHGAASAVKPHGGYDWSGLARAFARDPRGFARAARDARYALGRLTRASKSFLGHVLDSGRLAA